MLAIEQTKPREDQNVDVKDLIGEITPNHPAHKSDLVFNGYNQYKDMNLRDPPAKPGDPPKFQ